MRGEYRGEGRPLRGPDLSCALKDGKGSALSPPCGGHLEPQAGKSLVSTRSRQLPKVGRRKRARVLFGFLEGR